MTDSMIERVARAIHGASLLGWRGDSIAEQRAIVEACARAALEAMREPTDLMLNAAMAHWRDDRSSTTFAAVRRAKGNVYTTMIDAALEGK